MHTTRSYFINYARRVSAPRGIMQSRAPILSASFSDSTNTNIPPARQIEARGRPDRPISPHLTVLAFPLMAISSATHRACGITLTIGMFVVGIGHLSGFDMAEVMYKATHLPVIGFLGKFTMGFAFTYHYLAGLRDFYWDRYPDGLDCVSQHQNSVAIYAGSIGSALFLAMI